MLKAVKCGLFFFLVFVFGIVTVSAGDQDRKRDRKRDGSCQGYSIEQDTGFTLAGDQDRKRDRKRDGSCNS